MKRRNAILLGSVFLLITAGYVAWCWRPFYSPRPVRYTDAPSEEVKALVERWQSESQFGMPYSFDRDIAIRLLANPWRPYRQPMEVQLARTESGEMMCEISNGGGSCIMAGDRYIKRDGKWMNETDLPEDESHVLPPLPSAP